MIMTSNVNVKVLKPILSKVDGPFFLTPGALNHPVISATTIDSKDIFCKNNTGKSKMDEVKFSTENQNKAKTEDKSKAYRCQICHKFYIWKYNLNRHLKYECGTLKRFKCWICSKKFHHKENCVEHIKRIHKNFQAT